MKYATYSEYKPSHVDWLGDVPSHWAVKAIKWESPVLRGASPRPIDDPIYFDDDGEYAWVRIADVTEAGTYLEYTEQSLSDIGARLSVKLKPGDLFLSIAGSVGKPCITRIKCCIHDGFVYFPRWKADPKFLYYLFASGEPYKGLGKMGTQLNLNTDTVGSIVIGLPDAEEQQSITRFLDAKTAQIDALVAQKRQLIAKLKEKRQALIARTVTRGLPPEAAQAAGLEPNTEMKDSGVDWLSEIPSHWECKPIKHLGRIGNGSTPARDNSDYWEDGSFPWLNSSMVNEDSVSNAEEFVTASALRECHLPIIKPPAILIGITGQGRTRGMAATLLIEATINQHVAYVEPMPHLVNVHFLRRVFDNAYLYLRSESDGGGSTKGAITCDQIANLNVPLPPRVEQQAIAAYLDREITQLEALATKVESAIARLTEYRQALITSAVTGKIDVRELA